jgi:hypothetical protein
MSRIKYAVDSPHVRPWLERIGKIILNFSSLEFESVSWLGNLAELDDLQPAFKMPFASRVQEIMQQIEARPCSKRWRRDALRAWNEALHLARVRNQIAHNPVVFAWRTRLEVGEPDFIGIPATRTKGKSSKHGLLSRAKADQTINEATALVGRLEKLRKEWSELRDKGLVPAVSPAPSPYRRLLRLWRMHLYARRAKAQTSG